ncbi:MAG: hypothetical protein AAB019_02300 [Planctomycetota bacterium]
MKIKKIGIIIFCGILIALSSIIISYGEDNGITFFGKVVDENRKPVEGVVVRLYSEEDGKIVANPPRIFTDKNGIYKFEGISRGLYGLYNLYVDNSNDVKAIFPDKHAFLTPEKSPYLHKSIEVKDEKEVEVNFRIALGVKIKGKVTYEDGTPAKSVQFKSTDGWGTLSFSQEDGTYLLKGLSAEDKVITLTVKYSLYPPIRPTITDVVRLIKIPAKEGDEITQDLVVNKIDPNKISLQGEISVDGILYAPTNKDALEQKQIPPEGTPVFISLVNPQEDFMYLTHMMKGGKYECYNLPPGKYKLIASYQLIFNLPPEYTYKKGPIAGEKEIEIKKDETLNIDINFLLTPQEKVEFQVK